MNTRLAISASTALLCSAHVHAQLQIDRHSIDGGGGVSSGGGFSLIGVIGQPDAGIHAGGPFTLAGGFLCEPASTVSCYANCDGSTNPPILNVNDFVCFQQRFAASDPFANCDGSTNPPVLNVNDFVCFQQRFAAGCP